MAIILSGEEFTFVAMNIQVVLGHNSDSLCFPSPQLHITNPKVSISKLLNIPHRLPSECVSYHPTARSVNHMGMRGYAVS